MKQKLIELIPEFNLFKDEELKDRVLDVWIAAMEQGGWTVDDLDQIPFTLLIENCPASLVKHTRGVTMVSLEAGKILSQLYGDILRINMDHLLAGALLHDIGKLVEYEKVDGKHKKSRFGAHLRHPFSGVGLGYGKGIPMEVLHMIAVHAKEGDLGKRSPEATIIHHADFINFESLKDKV